MTQLWFALAAAASLVVPQPIPVRYARSAYGRTVKVCLDGRTVKTSFAGTMGFQDAASSWYSVCADVRTPIQVGQFFRVRPYRTRQFGGNVAKAGNIVARHFDNARTASQCAGLQIAVWEAIEDGGALPGFSSGRFQVHADLEVLNHAIAFYQAIREEGDAVYLQAGGQDGGGGQGQLTS